MRQYLRVRLLEGLGGGFRTVHCGMGLPNFVFQTQESLFRPETGLYLVSNVRLSTFRYSFPARLVGFLALGLPLGFLLLGFLASWPLGLRASWLPDSSFRVQGLGCVSL